MIKQATQRGICDNCGADIRPDALFCYHCGAQVANVATTENGNAKKSVAVAEAPPKIEKNPSADLSEFKKPERENSGQLKKSPAAPRRKIVKKEPDAARFVWVEKESASNVWFVIAALIIAAIAAVVLMAMLYIK